MNFSSSLRIALLLSAIAGWRSAAQSPSFSLALGAGLLPATSTVRQVDAAVTDDGGRSWAWAFQSPAPAPAGGLTLCASLHWGVWIFGLDVDVYGISFASEVGKRGRLYGALLSTPFGLRSTFGPLELTGFVAPTLVLGGFGFGTFAQQGAPIDFGTRFFDDETALHLLETSFGLAAGVEARVPLGAGLELFVAVSGLRVLATQRALNIAGFADEAQSKVEWVRRPLGGGGVAIRLDGTPLEASGTALGFDGVRLVSGLAYRWSP